MNASANGFGFDAALVSVFFALRIFYTKYTIWKLILGALLVLSLYALLMSGTRAAIVFYLVAFLAFAILRYSVRTLPFCSLGS
jgi:VIT1/CCC1 family predicted Fe2+/Mn2+ transporter